MSLHDRIKEARKNKGLTQEQLGKLIGVAKTTVTGYEKNREPTAAKVGEIADALDVDVNFLFQDEVKEFHENHATPMEFENIIKKYRSLDSHGKEMVDFTLEKEYERSKNCQLFSENDVAHAPISIVAESGFEYGCNLNAAHQRTDINAPEHVDTSDDDIMDDENF